MKTHSIRCACSTRTLSAKSPCSTKGDARGRREESGQRNPDRPLVYTSRVRRLAPISLLILLATSIAVAERGVPTPASVFGFEPGADYKLATYDQSIEYFRKLAASTKYVQLVEAGKTSEGRPMIFALVSTPENLSKIDRYREIARRLAHPRGLSDADARRLASEGKAFVHLDGGLHSTEVAGG